MNFFQSGNPSILIRGFYDSADFWNMVDKVFTPMGYKQLQCYEGLAGGQAGIEYKSEKGFKFTFEYDDWGSLELYPEDPQNEDLLNELHQLADTIEHIGSKNPDQFYQQSLVSRKGYPERQRIIYKKY